jgi:3-deoxy-7-phosphoheptulonate synthase
MIFILEKETTQAQIDELVNRLEWMGFKAVQSKGEGQSTLTIVGGNDKTVDFSLFTHLDGVKEVKCDSRPYKLASRLSKENRTMIKIKETEIGGQTLAVMAGPCAIESEEQLMLIAQELKRNDVHFLRGGAFKPRTSPYSFQGLGEKGLQYLHKAGQIYDLVTVSEVMDEDQLELSAPYIDILQIGARNMQNFNLLKKLGKVKNPILLKRGFSATYQDLLMAAEYILSSGNPNVILCERGIRTYETHTRNTLDLAAVPVLKELSHLPIIVDPSHGTGIRSLVKPMALAGVAAGAHGIMIEIHPEPDKAVSDAEQTLDFKQFSTLIKELKILEQVMNNRIKEKEV